MTSTNIHEHGLGMKVTVAILSVLLIAMTALFFITHSSVAGGAGQLHAGTGQASTGAGELAAGAAKIEKGAGTLATATAGIAPTMLPWMAGIVFAGIIALALWVAHRVRHNNSVGNL